MEPTSKQQQQKVCRCTNPFTLTVGGVGGSANPSVDGVGVSSMLVAAGSTDAVWPMPGFLAIFDLVSRTGTVESAAVVTGFVGGTRLTFDLVTRCGGVSTISLSSSSSSSALSAAAAVAAVLSYKQINYANWLLVSIWLTSHMLNCTCCMAQHI